jgi:outer membrane protein assembly factor BamA
MGNGRPLSLDITYSLRGLSTELLYVDPWLFDSDFALRAKVFEQERDEVGYSKEEAGFRADLTRKFKPQVEYGLFIVGKNVNITETDIPQEFLGPGSYQLVGVGVTQSLDFRDNPVSPSKGWVWTLGLDADAVAGQVAFGRVNTRLSYYLPIAKKYLLAFGARGGLILPFTEVPIDERFFSGGATTVRSFRERRLGPMDPGGHPIGGEAYTVFNVEFTVPIKDALAGAVFVDAGNLESEIKNSGLNDMRYAIGVGLRYKLPVGPVRLDVGFNPDPKKNEEWGAVNFSFGFAF